MPNSPHRQDIATTAIQLAASLLIFSVGLNPFVASAATEAAARPAETVPDLGMKLVWIAPGEFTMGSPANEAGRRANEGPQTAVKLTHGFWLGSTEVTQGQWRALMDRDLVAQARLAQVDDTQYLISGKKMMYMRDFAGVERDGDTMKMVANVADDLPIYWVSWEEAVIFCRKLNEREKAARRLPEGYEYRLPTEAEWEYACRAGTQEATYAGNLHIGEDRSAPELDAIAWYTGTSGIGYTGHSIDSSNFSEKKEFSAGKAGPRVVGTKKPNAWGLYDMLGNAAEWCLDWSSDYPGGNVIDPTGPATGKYRVRRGGGWSSNATLTRAAYRNWHEPTYRWSNLGLRVALATPVPSGSGAIRDSLAVQESRNNAVAAKGKKAFYTHKFNLEGIPHYAPEAKIAGPIRLWGSNYFADGNIAKYWEDGFRQFHPDATFEYNLKSPNSALPALFTGVADVGVGKLSFEQTLTYQRVMGYLPLQVAVVTGSLDIAGWSNALCIYVHKDNPIAHLSRKQLDQIFGAARTGGWEGLVWHPEFARGADENIRTWGQLGLTGEWANKPIHVYGLNLRDGHAIVFANRVLRGGDKWNEDLRMYANYAKPDGKLALSYTQLMEGLSSDPLGIAYSGYSNLTPETKRLPLAIQEEGPYVEPTLESVQDHTYLFSDEVYMAANRAPNQALDPKVREYLRYVLSREGQEAVQRDGKYLPLTAELAREQLSKLQ
ncbi:MAG: phosphate transporter periplasmic phosphate-binding protein [Verrucomicrobia bacterium]|nr:phosphate transporter periplasmic phosphate-binding protein [Verrucomicrobiota bacterium]